MRRFLITIVACLMAVMPFAQHARALDNPDHKKILMVISSHGEDAGQTAPGYEFEEFSKAYLVFTENGLTVDVASPTGGKVEADKFDPEGPSNARVLADAAIMAKLENSLALSTVDAKAYDAIFVVGGKGAMFDLPDHKHLQHIIRDIYSRGGTVSAVCHGPAALVNVRLPDGSYMVADKKVNGFTNGEEKLFGQKWLKEFSFLLEDKLISRGGQFQSSPMMLAHVAVDGRLITGQNPSSTPMVAEAVLRSLGIEPAPRKRDKDEITLALVAKLLAEGVGEGTAYYANKETYNGALISMYGYYYAIAATTEAEIKTAIELMSLKTEMANHPRLRLQVANSWHKAGDSQKALMLAKSLLSDDPDFEPVKSLIAKLEAE